MGRLLNFLPEHSLPQPVNASQCSRDEAGGMGSYSWWSAVFDPDFDLTWHGSWRFHCPSSFPNFVLRFSLIESRFPSKPAIIWSFLLFDLLNIRFAVVLKPPWCLFTNSVPTVMFLAPMFLHLQARKLTESFFRSMKHVATSGMVAFVLKIL